MLILDILKCEADFRMRNEAGSFSKSGSGHGWVGLICPAQCEDNIKNPCLIVQVVGLRSRIVQLKIKKIKF